jgi:hypothetical protein
MGMTLNRKMFELDGQRVELSVSYVCSVDGQVFSPPIELPIPIPQPGTLVMFPNNKEYRVKSWIYAFDQTFPAMKTSYYEIIVNLDPARLPERTAKWKRPLLRLLQAAQKSLR